jgi:hypothetical protein
MNRARRPVPAAVFLPPVPAPAPIVPPGWWRNGKTLVLDFRPAPCRVVHDEGD